MRAALAPLVDEVPEGIRRAELATPFPVGPVNCYLLVEDPVTVVDPGMMWADTPARLEALLADAGLRLGDVGQILVTHGHPDHFGAAGWLARASGAPIICGRAEQAKIVDGFAARYTTGALGALVEGLGLPREIRETFAGFYGGVGVLVEKISADQVVVLDDAATLAAGGRLWQVHVTPGHAAGHVSLFDPAAATLLGGDHLLAEITPNPVLEPDSDSPLGRRRSLVEYLASLERFVRLDPAVVLTGHGPAFSDLAQWAVSVRHHHDRRAEEVLDAVRQLGEPTPFQLSAHLFPNLDGISHMLGISEVVGHLDLLSDVGAVCCVDGSPLRYAST